MFDFVYYGDDLGAAKITRSGTLPLSCATCAADYKILFVLLVQARA